MDSSKRKFFKFEKISRSHFFLYLALVTIGLIVLNRFPVRFDLTSEKIFTLSKLSQSIVRDLKDPLRIKIFISKNLPPPLNDMETTLRDLLEEYAEMGNDRFNFVFYPISEKEADTSRELKNNIEMAGDYGIYPQQIQTIEKDEVKLVKIYLGMVIEYGDLIERVPFIKSADQLEFQLTTIFEKMNHKINSLLALKEKIKVTLFLDDQFISLSPFFNISGLESLKEKMAQTMKQVNRQNYDRIDYQVKNKLSRSEIEELSKAGMRIYPWDQFSVPRKGRYEAGTGVAALTVSYLEGEESKKEFIELLAPESVLQIGEKGLEQVTRFKMINLERFDEVIDGVIDSLLQVNDDLAYLNEKNTLSVLRQQSSIFQPGGGSGDAENFFNLLQKTYTVNPIALEGLSTRYKSLIIAGAREKFTDYELFLIDQFLMKGRSLIVFHDAHYNNQLADPMAQFRQTPPQWVPNNNGLDEMLKHYGVEVEKAYVMDKKSFIARSPNRNGGINEQNIYFAPLIQSDRINQEFEVISKINDFIALEVAPIKVLTERLKDQGLKSIRLFSSSKESWLMKDNIMLRPGFISPPGNSEQLRQYDLGYILEGEFESYFKGKKIPVKKTKDDDSEQKKKSKSPEKKKRSIAQISSQAKSVITQGKPGKILVIGSSALVRNNLIDQIGNQPNSALILNLVDYINQRGDWAIMRSKGQRAKPLEPYKTGDSFLKNRSFLKFFNIVGLPLLVCLIGLIGYWARNKRRKNLEKMF